MIEIKRLSTMDPGFWEDLEQLRSWEGVSDEVVVATVSQIVADVRAKGDQAVLEYTRDLDRCVAGSMQELEIPKERLLNAFQGLPAEDRQALEFSRKRISDYHEHQLGESWTYTEADGTMLGQKVTPMDRVGLYVPGGKAVYPSSVLMNAVPAKVAGVSEIVMVVPTPDGQVNDWVLAAAHVAGVDRVFTIGGAQAVAALAYGTQTVPKVDIIVGPGNIYVATAKRMVYGVTGIDMIAGPSEILVVCDGKTDPDWIAMDLFSQAEHDEDAQSILVTQDLGYINRVHESIDRLLKEMERSDVIRESLVQRAAFIQVRDMDEAVEVVNASAPEHLELSVDDPEKLLEGIRHAGAVFMGRYTAEAVGDYCAGPNHVLPTSRTARFSSPLGVYDFQKRSSLIMCTKESADNLGRPSSHFARREGLTAHARSAEYRFRNT